jgi:hypothetical protein
MRHVETSSKTFHLFIKNITPALFITPLIERFTDKQKYYTNCQTLLTLIPLTEKILSTPSFGGEVKPSVPCRRFAACKRFLELSGYRCLGQICRYITRPRRVPPSATRGLSRPWTWRHLAEKVGTSKSGESNDSLPYKLAQDAVCQSHTGRLTGLWFLLNRPKGCILTFIIRSFLRFSYMQNSSPYCIILHNIRSI